MNFYFLERRFYFLLFDSPWVSIDADLSHLIANRIYVPLIISKSAHHERFELI